MKKFIQLTILFILLFIPCLNSNAVATEYDVDCHSWNTCSSEGDQTRTCQYLTGPNAGMTYIETRDCTPEQEEDFNLNPTFDKIEPEIIVPGESVVTITGNDFGKTKGDSYVALVEVLDYNYISDFKSWSNNEIQFNAPNDISADEIQVRIGDRYGSYHSFKNYYVQPSIKSIEPSSGYSGDIVKIDLDKHPNEIFPGDVIVDNLLGENIKNEVTSMFILIKQRLAM